MPPRTISDEFNDSYAEQGLQPSVGTREIIKYTKVEYSNQNKAALGTVARAGGIGMQRGGKGMGTVGRNMSQAGLAMSRSGVGAIVGVPLVVVGGAVQAVGATTQAAGKASSQTGRTLQRGSVRGKKLSLKNPKGIANEIKKHAKATRVNVMILSWATPFWFMLQLPLALVGLVAFGSASAAAELLPAWLVEWTAGGLLELLHVAVFFIGVGTLIAMGIIYAISGIKCFFGEGSHLKGPVFCLAVVGYLLPFTNVFPWFILWALAVWRYPK